MFRLLSVAALAAVLTACTSLKVTELDSRTGYFPTASKATVTVNKPVDLDARKALIVVPNSEFAKGQVTNIGYFAEIINLDDLEKQIIVANLGDKIPALRDRIGINNAAKYYKPFLWLRYSNRGTGRDRYTQLILTDPVTMEDYLVAETHLDFVWTGVNDQNNWYPMYNALIDYIRQNSKTYKK